MKRLAYILHINGMPTGQGAVMTPEEAERANETLPDGHQWKDPKPALWGTPFYVLRLDGTRKSYGSHADYEDDLQAGESVEYIKTQDNTAEKAA